MARDVRNHTEAEHSRTVELAPRPLRLTREMAALETETGPRSIRNVGSRAASVVGVRRPGRVLELSNTGAGTLDTRDITAMALRSCNSGTGAIKLAGSVQVAVISNHGSGAILARDLIADRVRVTNDGSGTVIVHAVERVTLVSNGSGKIIVHGHPESRLEINAGGGVISYV